MSESKLFRPFENAWDSLDTTPRRDFNPDKPQLRRCWYNDGPLKNGTVMLWDCYPWFWGRMPQKGKQHLHTSFALYIRNEKHPTLLGFEGRVYTRPQLIKWLDGLNAFLVERGMDEIWEITPRIVDQRVNSVIS